MTNRIARHGFTLAALLCAATSAQAEDQNTGRYIMTVYSDMAQGRAILGGSPGELIEELNQEQSGTSFSLEENVNLCVAYTQTKQVDAATTACDAAVIASAEEFKRARRAHAINSYPARQAKTGQAIAMANRGVLYALTGELDMARDMFEEALKLDSQRSQIRKNLRLLEEDLTAAN